MNEIFRMKSLWNRYFNNFVANSFIFHILQTKFGCKLLELLLKISLLHRMSVESCCDFYKQLSNPFRSRHVMWCVKTIMKDFCTFKLRLFLCISCSLNTWRPSAMQYLRVPVSKIQTIVCLLSGDIILFWKLSNIPSTSF